MARRLLIPGCPSKAGCRGLLRFVLFFFLIFSGRRLHKLAPSETPTTEKNRRGWSLLGCFLETALLASFFLESLFFYVFLSHLDPDR